jgi:heme-degrading monooxygenase HmoA
LPRPTGYTRATIRGRWNVFARVTKLQGPAEAIDQATAYAQENILPRARQMKGWKGVLNLGDRSTGEGLLVTFWETEEDMRASEESGAQLRGESAEAAGGSLGEVTRYEVLVSEFPS